MIFTSYLAKLNKLPRDMVKIIITRYLPRGFDTNKYKYTYYVPSLAPTKEILKEYKNNGDWEKYVRDFNEYIFSNEESLNTLGDILKSSKINDIVLICYEKDWRRCHRNLIANWFREKGIEVFEYQW